MESVELKSAGLSSLTFVERKPFDTLKPADYFTIQLRNANLSASARVYAYRSGDLPALFTKIATNWQDFTGLESWSSLEGDFNLEVNHDGLGHFEIVAELRSRLDPSEWIVRSSVVFETSQLVRVASDISEFMGRQA